MAANMSSHRILLVCPLPPPIGGIATWSKMLVDYLKESFYVEYLIIDIAPRWRSSLSHSLVTRISIGSLQFIRDIIRYLFSLIIFKPTVVHFTTSGSLSVLRDLFLIGLADCCGIKTVYHLHFGRVPDLFKENTLEWRLLCLAAKHASRVIVLDSATAECLHALLPGTTVKVVPNCIDLAKFSARSRAVSDYQTALFLGWVIPGKGIFELLTAWTELAPPNWTLQVAGPFQVKYQEELKQCFPSVNIVYVGEVSHARAIELMSACDLFILPSHSEGFPISILEAMALSKPIIATTVGAIPEMLDNGRCGMLVPPKDVKSLTTALRDMINQKADMRALMGAQARARVEAKYSIEVVFDQYLNIWLNAGKLT